MGIIIFIKFIKFTYIKVPLLLKGGRYLQML